MRNPPHGVLNIGMSIEMTISCFKVAGLLGPKMGGSNSMDFDLWGVAALFKVCPDESIFLVPQQTGGRFVDPEGIEHDYFTLEEALGFFTSGDAIWIGAHGEAGRIGECDPQYVTPTPTPRS